MKTNTRDKIIEIAVDLFSKKGYNGVSIRDITRAVGIKESSLYNHFKSKDDLLNTIFDLFKTGIGNSSFNLTIIEDGLNQIGLGNFLIQHAAAISKRTNPLMAKIWKIVYMEQFRDERARNFVLNEIMKSPQLFYKKTFELASKKGMIHSKDTDTLAMIYQYAALTFTWEAMLRESEGEDLTELYNKRNKLIKYFCEGEKI